MVSALLYRLGRFCYRRRGQVLAAWLLVLCVVGGLALTAQVRWDDAFEVPGSSSQQALDSLKVTFPEAADASASLLITAPTGARMTDPEVKAAVADHLSRLELLPYVKGVQTPYTKDVKGLISADGRAALVRVRVEGSVSTFSDSQRADLTEKALTLPDSLPGSTVHVGGDVFSLTLPTISAVEAFGVVVALVVLVFTLGSLVAASMPIGSALTGVGVGASVLVLGATILTVGSTTLLLVLMIGVAVGIDYALFIISRHRHQLKSNIGVEESGARAVATAGSAVVFAGATVVIALIGLSFAGLPFLTMMGVFSATAVALEVLVALTLLPALLGFAGERLRPRPRRVRARPKLSRMIPHLPVASWWVRTVTRWPVLTIVVVLAGMSWLAMPAQDLELALPNSGRSAPGDADRITFDLISSNFGIGYNGPLVVTGSIVESEDPLEVVDGIRDDIAQMPGVKLIALATPNANVDTALVQIIPTTGPDDPQTAELVVRLREKAADWKARYDIDTSVTGLTAVQIDVTQKLRDALLPYGVFVVGLSLILLTMAFRSWLVPLKAVIGYAFSVAAAFGATVLVFNKGWLNQLVNLPETGPVISFLPIMGMGILFGLAMDYEMFLTSRMREEYVHGNTTTWVEDGFVHSAKVVTAAALIMFSVFAFFVPAGMGIVKPVAFALAVGVALDAFLVRMTLGPAVLKLLGNRTWSLPDWVDRRLPVLDVEGEALVHQLKLADWPRAGHRAAIYAEGLGAWIDEQELFSDVAVDLPVGGVLVVKGEPLQRIALLYGLTGRLSLRSGEVKVFGHVLPEEAGAVRRRTLVLRPTNTKFRRELARHHGVLILVDGADELTAATERILAAAMRHDLTAPPQNRPPTTWVLGVGVDTDATTLVDRPHQVLSLVGRELAASGGTR